MKSKKNKTRNGVDKSVLAIETERKPVFLGYSSVNSSAYVFNNHSYIYVGLTFICELSDSFTQTNK